MQEVVRQSFEAGRNTDAHPGLVPPNQYREAHNLEYVGDENFYALQNIKGTTFLKSFGVTAEEIGAFATKYVINDTIKSCITYFTVSETTFKIWCYDTESNDLYELYEETIPPDYNTDDRVVDGVNYPENGVDFLYFTDFYNPLRFIKCEIPSPYSANFLNAYDITLQRRGALGSIALTSVSAGGSLLSGTYQFAYRMTDPENKRFTKWSVLTNPVHVYDGTNGSGDVVYSGVGLFTNKKITLSITPSTEETDNLDYIQLAVVENIGSTAPTTASLLEITSIPSTSLTFEYKANSRIGEVSLADLTVDLAQIKAVKSLRVSGNRLFGGNTKYFDLSFDNGTPQITSGSVIAESAGVADSYSDEEFSSTRVGHWRDEVYRYGVVYEDAFGNKSTVSPLDLSSVTGNTISGSTDLKYPARDTTNTAALFNTSGEIQALGLRILGLTNHPSWARKLYIVRVPRKKDIQFQSPIIPMVEINGIGAFGNYPATYRTAAGPVTADTAQPMTSGYTLAPRNMMWPDLREISIRSADSTSGRLKGEALLNRILFSQNWMMWPGQNMYTSESYVFSGSEKLDVIDYALLKLYSTSDGTTPTAGDNFNTNLSGSFYALGSGDYYFDPNWVAKSIPNNLQNIGIVNSVAFENIGQPASLSGTSVMDYESLQTQGVNLGSQANIQKSVVVKLDTIVSDITSMGAVFANGTLNSVSPGSDVVQGTGIKYESASGLTNNFVTTYSGFSVNSYVNACYVANVRIGLGDDRYGDINSYHEYISTGATYTFTPSEIATLEGGGNVSVNIDVWGGDCFVGPQLFKICDTTYAVVNQQKNSGVTPLTHTTAIERWKVAYDASSGATIISLPVALENAPQYIQVILESEYNGEVRDRDIVDAFFAPNGIPYWNTQYKNTMRTPLTYRYNNNLSIGNTQKIFLPKLQYSFTQNDFPARIPYSEIKIYNGDQAGFDVFRAADFVDLEEERYGITKLVVDGDRLFAIQERGVTYVPVGERQIEQTDANQLAVRSGDVVGRPYVVDSKRGSKHLRGIIETGNGVYIPDAINKDVYILMYGQSIELKPVTKDNETLFRSIFSNEFGEKYVKGVWDFVRNEYWLIVDGKVQVFNPKVGWVGDQEFEPSAVYQEGLFLTGNEPLEIHSAYTGNPNELMGETVVPRVVVIVNPEPEFSKTFDNLLLPASEDLSTGDFTVENEGGGNQTVTGVILDANYIEGKYLVQLPYDSNHYRLRGLRLNSTIKWGDLQSKLQSIILKYRKSKRYPF